MKNLIRTATLFFVCLVMSGCSNHNKTVSSDIDIPDTTLNIGTESTGGGSVCINPDVRDNQNYEVSDDQKYETAIKNSDISALEQLANSGYAKAYSKLASIYLRNGNKSLADSYASKAIKAGVGRDEAMRIVEILDSYGLYDGKKYVKPAY